MGCGSSKQAPAQATAPADAPAPAAQVAHSKVQVVASGNTRTLESSPIKKERDVHSANSNDSVDSGIDGSDVHDSQGIITEASQGGECIAGAGRPETPDFELAGEGYRKSQNSIREMSAVSNKSTMSTVTTQSAPCILERPKSRGGVAFDVVYDEGTKSNRMPARLKAIEHKSKIKREATLTELQAKLAAAEKRRSEYEKRVKAKMLEESQKVEMAGRTLTRQKSDLGQKTIENENKARENRERHLKQMRDKLRDKEKKALTVRKNKERIARENRNTGAVEIQ